MIDAILGRVSAGEDLSMDEMTDTIDAMMRGQWTETQVMLLLNGLAQKEETIEEIAGAAVAMRRHMTPIRTSRTGVMDTCGTGGVGSEILNVSTAAAIVAAAVGIPVAKHGNRSVTSKSGSADVLRELGVNIEAPVSTVERCLEELGLCFCFAPQLHPAMKHVAAARKKLGIRTIFNLLGPLCNPASATYQLLGVGVQAIREKIAGALIKLGAHRAVIATGEDGMGEVTLATTTRITVVENNASRELTWSPRDFGLELQDTRELRIAGPAESAAMIRRVLAGEPGPARDIVLLNAAAAVWTADLSESLPQCLQLAQRAIDSHAAEDLLARLVEVSRQ